MPIVTLTTDFGQSDHYAAILKATLLNRSSGLNLVDISHNIKKYDIVHASYVLKNAYHHFPEGSIHLISVYNYPENKKCFLAIRYNGHYFIGPDNGVFSLIFEQQEHDMYELDYSPGTFSNLAELYAHAVGHIISNQPFNEIGFPVTAIEQKMTLQPVTTPDQIRGSVIYIDNYENVVVNINKDKFNAIGKGRRFSIYFKRDNPIRKLVSSYSDVQIGAVLCRFNNAEDLEIAVNMGKASSLLGLKIDDGIEVQFHD